MKRAIGSSKSKSLPGEDVEVPLQDAEEADEDGAEEVAEDVAHVGRRHEERHAAEHAGSEGCSQRHTLHHITRRTIVTCPPHACDGVLVGGWG